MLSTLLWRRCEDVKKARFALFVAVSLLVSALILGGCAQKETETKEEAKEPEVIKVGVVTPLTGDVATFGQSTKNAVQMAADEVNAEGGVLGKKIELVIIDDRNEPKETANAFRKLIDQDRVVAIIGSLTSKCTLAGAPIANAKKIPMITSSSTNPKVTLTGPYAFRVCFIDDFQGQVMAQFAYEDLSAKKAAILYDNGNDYSKGLAEFFEKSFTGFGGEVVAKEVYSQTDSDFNAQLTKIKNLNPDVIFLPDYYQKVALIAKQARGLGIKATFLGGDGWDSPELVKLGGDAIEGGYFSNHYSKDDPDAKVQEFVKKYKEKYGSEPDALAALAYDALYFLVAGIEDAGKVDSQAIRDSLEKMGKFDGVTGSFTLDKNRDPIKSAVVLKIEGGAQKFVKRVEPKQ
jgi:branched-chain amino acid transport system substrate-binding protein